VAGLVLGAFGFALLTRVDDANGLALVVAGSVLFSVGLAPLTTLSTDLMIGAAPPERAGAASAVAETTSEFGGALGIAVLGSIGAAAYRGHLADTMPAGVPPAAAEAFTAGLHLVFAINAALALGIAVLVAFLLRGGQPGDGPD
jgi:DHA2 family multidrug resistance protein-like MFS transporter